MSDLDSTSNDIFTYERPTSTHQRQPADALAVPSNPFSKRVKRPFGTFVGIPLVIVFWLVWYVAYTIFSFVNSPETATTYLLARALIAVTGAGISFAIAIALDRLRGRPLSTRAIGAAILALTATALHTAISTGIWKLFFRNDPTMMRSPMWVFLTTDYIVRLWFFCSVTAMILALTYVSDIRDREERIGLLQALAHSAQIRALHNQLNPHFLFNALNSVAGLISSKRVAEAEKMTENLADFLRLTLAMDPQQLITLEEEIRLQRLYLSIEQVRFPERLKVHIHIADKVSSARVPALFTQPLVENSIKYAVARSTDPVDLTITATSDDQFVQVVVTDNGGNSANIDAKGARLGLKNVAERLAMHFAGRAEFRANPRVNGGFENIIRFPFEGTE